MGIDFEYGILNVETVFGKRRPMEFFFPILVLLILLASSLLENKKTKGHLERAVWSENVLF